MSRVSASFTNNQVFEDPKINAACDLIVRTVDKYRDIDVVSDFAFYGVASEIYQGEPHRDVGIVEFITGRTRIYRAIIDKLYNEMPLEGLIAYKKFISCSINGISIRVIKSPNIINTVVLDGIVCYDYETGAQTGKTDPDPQPGEEEYSKPIVPNQNYK